MSVIFPSNIRQNKAIMKGSYFLFGRGKSMNVYHRFQIVNCKSSYNIVASQKNFTSVARWAQLRFRFFVSSTNCTQTSEIGRQQLAVSPCWPFCQSGFAVLLLTWARGQRQRIDLRGKQIVCSNILILIMLVVIVDVDNMVYRMPIICHICLFTRSHLMVSDHCHDWIVTKLVRLLLAESHLQ